MGGAGEKAEEELIGMWAGPGRKQRRSYWGGGRGWEESRGGVTGEVGGAGKKQKSPRSQVEA